MKYRTVVWCTCLTFIQVICFGQAENIGQADLEIYFNEAEAISQFEFSDPNAWRYKELDNGGALELFGKSDYQPKVRSPFNIAVLSEVGLGSFTLEVDLRQTGREYGHRDMVVLFGMKSASKFYYIHIASKADEHAHNIFLVNDAPRKAIGLKTNEGISWGDDWHKIRIERDVESGTILVYFNDFTTPIMEGKDTEFTNGFIGFGSFDDTGLVDNVRIWSKDVTIMSCRPSISFKE